MLLQRQEKLWRQARLLQIPNQGLGFMTNVAIDQHLFARNRQFDLFEILHNKPGLLGIGLDENTGILVEGDQYDLKKRRVISD